MSNQDKINALVSLKHWSICRQLYELASDVRKIEKSILEVTPDYISVIKDIEDLSEDQKQFIFSCDLFKHLNKEKIRDLKISLIQNGSR